MSKPHHVTGSEPYPWPWHGELEPARLALLVVTAPEDSGAVTPPQLSGLADLVVSCAASGVLVAEVRTTPPPARRPVPPRPPSAGSWPTDVVVEPVGWDGFHATPLDDRLRAANRDTLVLAGWWLETGVHSTLRSANDRGYECLLLTDLVSPLAEATRPGSISSIHMSGGIFGATGRSAEFLTALTVPSAPIAAVTLEALPR